MGYQTVAEEGTPAVARQVEDLVGDDQVTGDVIVAQAAAGGDSDQALNAQRLEGVDVGAVVDLGGRDMVTDAMPGEEGNLNAIQRAGDDGGRWLSEGGGKFMLGDVLNPGMLYSPEPPMMAREGLISIISLFIVTNFIYCTR